MAWLQEVGWRHNMFTHIPTCKYYHFNHPGVARGKLTHEIPGGPPGGLPLRRRTAATSFHPAARAKEAILEILRNFENWKLVKIALIGDNFRNFQNALQAHQYRIGARRLLEVGFN